MQINFSVNKQIISAECPGRLVVAGTRGHVFAGFTLDPEWDGLAVTALFANDFVPDGPKEVVLTGGEPVEIPPEVLATGKLRVSLVGVKDGGEYRLTTKYMDRPIIVVRSGAVSGDTTEAVSPALWEQILAMIGDLGQLNTTAKETLVAAINEAAKTGSGAFIDLDTTLSIAGKAADAKAVGDALTRRIPVVDELPDPAEDAAPDVVYLKNDETDVPDGEADYIPAPETAEIGQTIRVTEVDENGKPTAWEAATLTANDVGAQLPIMVVDIVTGTANYTPAEIYAHVQAGGDAISYGYTGVRHELVSVNSNRATFAYVDVPAGSAMITKTILSIAADGKSSSSMTQISKLPNPNTLKFTGAVTDEYDGSKELSVEIPSGDFVPVPATATVGQIMRVSAVDETGKPTAWEPVDMPSGGSSYTLPVATAETLGGVKPVAATEGMTQSVGVDTEGRLFVDAYSREYVDNALGAYITDIDTLVGGGE